MAEQDAIDDDAFEPRPSGAQRPPAPGTALIPVVPAIKRRQRLVGGIALAIAALGLALPLIALSAARAEGRDWSSPAFVGFFGAQLLAVALGVVARRDRLGAVGLVVGAVMIASALILMILCAPPR